MNQMKKGKLAIQQFNYDNGSVVLRIIDLDESKKTRALRILRKAIRCTGYNNSDIYADASYTVIDGVASTHCINIDLARDIVKEIKKEYDISTTEDIEEKDWK